MSKRLLTFFLAVVWLWVANHCAFAAAYASPVAKAHHCGSKDSSSPTGPHERCPVKVCCEQFSPMTAANSDLTSPSIFWAFPSLPSNASNHVPQGTAEVKASPEAHAVDPPIFPLVMSLALAQNAPPQ